MPPYPLFFLFSNCLVNLVDTCPDLFEFNYTLLLNCLVSINPSYILNSQDSFLEMEYLVGAKVKTGNTISGFF